MNQKPANFLWQALFRGFAFTVRHLPYERGQRAIASRIPKWCQSKFDFNFWCSPAQVTWSATGYPDLLTRHMLFQGSYQDDVLWMIREFVQPGMTFFDIGGHHGLMSVVAGKTVGPAGKVITFEPNPTARAHIRAHAALNHLENIFIQEIALSDSAGEFPFYVQSGNLSWNSTLIKDFSNFKNRQEILVKTETLDHYVSRTQSIPQAMKIDVEGSEFLVIQGAKQVIRQHRPLIMMEFNPASATAAGTTLQEYIALLQELGYDLRVPLPDARGRYSRERLEIFDVEQHAVRQLTNVLCLPIEK